MQVGPRLEDFKTSRVHAAFVLKHGTVPGVRLMGERDTDREKESERGRARQPQTEKRGEEEKGEGGQALFCAARACRHCVVLFLARFSCGRLVGQYLER